MSGKLGASRWFWLSLAVLFFVLAALRAFQMAPTSVDALLLIGQVFLCGLMLWRSSWRRETPKTEAGMTPSHSPMSSVRQNIDELDDELVALLARRQRQIETAATIKRANGIPALVPERVDEVLRNVAAQAEKRNLDGGLAKALWTAIIEWSIAYEERLMKQAAEKDRA